MALSVLEEIKKQKPSELRSRSRESLNWFREQLRKIRVPYNNLIAQSGDYAESVELGKFYMYVYEAKWQDKLPYWDRFPFVLPFRYASGGFYGVNFHYIRPADRLLLLEELYRYAEEDDDTRIKFTYGMIKSISALKYAKPCVKRYLYDHIDSRICEVKTEFWDMLVMIPSQNFNENANTVYAQSRNKY